MILEVYYKGREKIGILADDSSNGLIFFEYNQAWIQKKKELSPLHLPLAVGTLPQAHHHPSFQGLHGLFWDSLPDAWGKTVLEERLRKQGINLEKLSPLVELSYLGARTMGAITYFPDADPEQEKILEAVSLAAIDREASYLLEGKPIKGKAEEVLALFQAGCSAGGAKPKVLASLQNDHLHIGPHVVPGWEGWIIKLSSIPPSYKDSKEEGRMEYAYSLMARAAGIDMPPTRLFEVERKKNRRGLFGVKRFDCQGDERIHFHSVAGLVQKDFRFLEISYEDVANIILNLTGDFSQVVQLLHRLVFNVAVGNCDDHAKNQGFLMNDQGQWSLSPAFDLTLSAGMNKMNQHAMSVNGTRTPCRKDIKAFTDNFGISSMVLDTIIEKIMASVQYWPQWAEEAGCRKANIQKVKSYLKERSFSL